MKKISPKTYDFRMAQALLPRFGKKTIETLIDQEFDYPAENLSEIERAFFLEKLASE